MAVSVDVLKLTQVEGVVCVRGTAAINYCSSFTMLKNPQKLKVLPTANIKGSMFLVFKC